MGVTSYMGSQSFLETVRNLEASLDRLFQFARTAEEIEELDAFAKDKITYRSGIALSELVKPSQGWDPLGR